MIRVAKIALLLAALAPCAPAAADTIAGDRIVVIDGDTVALPCAAEFAGRYGCSERVRLYNIDAPETRRADCEAERLAGLRAKEALAAILRGRSVEIRRCEPSTGRCADRYGRTLAALRVETGDVGQALIAAGLAEPWREGKAAKASRKAKWCGGRS